MAINNKYSWAEWFSVPNILLELHTGLTRQAIVKSRNALKQYGLIDFRTNGTKATEYKMNPMSNSLQDSLQVGCQVGLQDGLQVGCQVGCTLNKLNKTKQNKTKQEKKNKKEKIFVAPTLDEVKNYVEEKGLNVNAEKFFNYYEATGWKDAKGNKVLSWKGKAQTWDGRATMQENTAPKQVATFSDLLREGYENDEEGNVADARDNANGISTILSEYTIE